MLSNKERVERKKAIQGEVKKTLDTYGWKLIEEDIKTLLTNEYREFMKVKESNVREKQMKITLMLQIVSSIYEMAGQEWTFHGYKEIGEAIGDDSNKEKERKLYEKAINELRS